VLIAHGLLRKDAFVKVLARGEVTGKFDVHAHAVSKAAEAAITAAGGTVTLIPLPFEGEGKAGRPAAKGNQFTNR
jgi:large subunit ribosomal protein L15